MNKTEIINLVNSPEYDFLRTDKRLGNNIILLTLGGSYAYGTNTEDSDVDVRGIATNSKMEILTGNYFEQVIDEPTDTTVYSLKKIVQLLSNCNPNTIEMLGCRPDHYLRLTDVGKLLIENSHMFLSQRAAYSFGGYANSQLRRLDNKSARLVGQSQQEQHILNSIENARISFREHYFDCPDDAIKLYIDDAVNKNMESEIFMDINLHHYPLRDYKCMWSQMHNIVKDYAKIGRRNTRAIQKDKLGKHSMHLIRLYMMALDILENEKIVTYREKEHDLLMDIRNGKYLDDEHQPIPEFFEMVDEFEKRLEYAKKNTSLPKDPDYKKINEFVADVNYWKIVKDEP